MSAWNWTSLQPRRGGVVEMDAVPMTSDNANVGTRGMFKLAAQGNAHGSYAVLDVAEAKIVRDRLSAWIAAIERAGHDLSR